MWCRSRLPPGPTTRSARELIDGVVWGRGAVDMKQMVAMELGVMAALAASAAPSGGAT